MVKIGILGGADIAYRMFLPALQETEGAVCSLIASRQLERRSVFEKNFGVRTVEDYDIVLNSPEIDVVYIPLPPALHYQWAKKALECGKHVFLEKPSTTSYSQTQELVEIAHEKHLVLQENYMFQFHRQIKQIFTMIDNGIIGDVRLYRASFGFPLRQKGDFRYSKRLGGGALLDAGGYVTKLASLCLGDMIKVKAACLNYEQGYDVDMYGNVTFENDKRNVVQGSFSLDCYYQCALEVWGNKGKLFTNRIFTAPPGYSPSVKIETGEGENVIQLEPDNHFKHSIEEFLQAMKNEDLRRIMAIQMKKQSELIDEIRRKANDTL